MNKANIIHLHSNSDASHSRNTSKDTLSSQPIKSARLSTAASTSKPEVQLLKRSVSKSSIMHKPTLKIPANKITFAEPFKQIQDNLQQQETMHKIRKIITQRAHVFEHQKPANGPIRADQKLKVTNLQNEPLERLDVYLTPVAQMSEESVLQHLQEGCAKPFKPNPDREISAIEQTIDPTFLSLSYTEYTQSNIH